MYDITTWLTDDCNAHIKKHLRSKNNHAIKFGQLIDYNVRNIFLEKSYRKFCRETSPRPFLENWNLAYLWVNSLKFYTVYFYWVPSWWVYKQRSGTSLSFSVWALFLKKKYILLTDQISLSGWLSFVRYWTIYEL